MLMVFVALFLFSAPTAGESKNEWTDKEAIQFAEDLFFLVETIAKETGPDSRVSLDSYTIHGGTIRIMGFRFPDDRIIRKLRSTGMSPERTARGWSPSHR